MAYRISVAQQKGGSCKTTHSTNLAGMLSGRGSNVMLLDTDIAQGSSTLWCAVRYGNEILGQKGELRTTRVDSSKILDRELAALGRSSEFDIVIVDGAPQIRDLTVSMIRNSDLIIIPILPSPYDIAASTELIQLVVQQIKLREGTHSPLHAGILISQEIPNTLLGSGVEQQIRDELTGVGIADEDIPPFLQHRTSRLVAYPKSAGNGMTVEEYEPTGKAAMEMTSILNELIAKFGVPAPVVK